MTNYQNTHEIMDNYGNIIMLKIKASTVTSCKKNPSNLKIQPLDIFQNQTQSRTFTDH